MLFSENHKRRPFCKCDFVPLTQLSQHEPIPSALQLFVRLNTFWAFRSNALVQKKRTKIKVQNEYSSYDR